MALRLSESELMRWWAPVLQALAASLGLALVAAAVFEIQDARDSGVTELQLEGVFQHISADQVRDALLPLPTGGVFGTQLEAVKARLEKLPWIAHARVERAWPGLLRIRLWEYSPYAQWNDALLSMDNEVFRVPDVDVPEGLPRLAGPEGREQYVRQTFDLLTENLRGTDFMPTALVLDARGDWLMQVAGGMELRLDRGDPLEQSEFIKGPVSQALTGRLSEVKYVDLHYTNGFAVGWANCLEGQFATANDAPGKARPDCRHRDVSSRENRAKQPEGVKR
jgi:cell division protein FtsQ